MKYTISIDQTHSISWGLSLSEAAMFSFLYSVPAWAEQIFVDNQVWFFASRNKAIDEMPIISDKSDTVYRLYKSLQTKGVIDWKKFGEKDCIRITEKGKQWNSLKTTLGNKSEDTRKNIRKKTENNPTYNSTKNNTTINNNKGCDFSNPLPDLEVKNPFIRQSIHDSLTHDSDPKEKVSGQKEKVEREPSETYLCFSAFASTYERLAGVTYPSDKNNYIMTAKDGANCKKLITWLKKVSASEQAPDEMVKMFTTAAWQISDKWLKANFTISNIYSQANNIYTKFMYSNPAAQEKRRQEEIERLVNEYQP
jgi:hypothetical protein